MGALTGTADVPDPAETVVVEFPYDVVVPHSK